LSYKHENQPHILEEKENGKEDLPKMWGKLHVYRWRRLLVRKRICE
jgi:hypothetical protein